MDAASVIRSVCADVLAIAKSLDEGGSPQEAAAELRNVAAGLSLLADILERERGASVVSPKPEGAP